MIIYLVRLSYDPFPSITLTPSRPEKYWKVPPPFPFFEMGEAGGGLFFEFVKRSARMKRSCFKVLDYRGYNPLFCKVILNMTHECYNPPYFNNSTGLGHRRPQ